MTDETQDLIRAPLSEMTHDTRDVEQQQGPGSLLKQARLERRLELSDVALQLHLSPAAIEALENNHFKYFPSVVFVRGHLRSYARLLNVSADEVIAHFNQLGLDEPKAKLVPTKVYVKPAYLNDKVLRVASYVIALVIILTIALWWSHHSSSRQELVSPSGDGSVIQSTGDSPSSTAKDAGLTPAQQQAAQQQLQQMLPQQGAVSSPTATTNAAVSTATPSNPAAPHSN